MKLAVIIGVSHHYQLGRGSCSENEAQSFRKKLTELIQLHEIELLAEELHQDFLEDQKESQCFAVSKMSGVDHLYCDFSRQQRGEKAILGPQDIQIMMSNNQIRGEDAGWKLSRSLNLRELHWVSQLIERDQWPVLLVVGSNHVRSVAEKLRTCGVSPEISSEIWFAV